MKMVLIALWGIVHGVIGSIWNMFGVSFITHPGSEPGMRDWEEDQMFIPIGYIMLVIWLMVTIYSYYRVGKSKKNICIFSIAWLASMISGIIVLSIDSRDMDDSNKENSNNQQQTWVKDVYKDVDELYDEVTELDNLVDICQGDIGNDKKNDVVLIYEEIEDPPPDALFFDEQRIMCVFTESDYGKYLLKYTNDRLIPGEGAGGMVGDPYRGMAIEDGILKVSEYAGSSERFGADYYFGYRNYDFVICKYVSHAHNTHTANGVRSIYDFDTGNVEQYATTIESSEPLLIYRGTFKFEKVKFVDSPDFSDVDDVPKDYLPRINIEGMFDYFGTYEDAAYIRDLSINRGAIEALDRVKDNNYPNMKKVQMELDKEILDNWKYLLSYEIPDYYYEDDNGDVLYFDYVTLEDGKLVYNMYHSTDQRVELEAENFLTNEDFIIENKESYIQLNGKVDEMRIGDKLVSHSPLSEKRAYEVYYYENINISVGLDIFSIVLVTSKFETARGIKVGDSIDKVFENYGVTKKDDECECYTYCGPYSQKIIFEVDKNDIITRIELELPG